MARKRSNRPRRNVVKVDKPESPVPLGPILFPGRLDLVKRAEFIPFYLEHRGLWRKDREAFIELARRESEVTLRHPIVTADLYQRFMRVEPWTAEHIESRAERLFKANMETLVSLYHSIAKGWDDTYPIRLKKLLRPLPTVDGRPPTNDVVFSDGQHRLIVLIALGQRQLEIGQCRIAHIDSEFDPLEVTHCYIEGELCTEEEFCDFARWRYDVPEDIKDTRTLYEWGMDNDIADWWERYMRDYWEDRW